MIDRQHKLSVVCQAKLLGFSRGSVYYLPRPVPDSDLTLMRRIDQLAENGAAALRLKNRFPASAPRFWRAAF